MPLNVYDWIISYLAGLEQIYKVYNTLSKPVRINMSIVQGSGIGPSFIMLLWKVTRTLNPVIMRHGKRCCFNVRSKTDTSQFNLPHKTNN